MKKILTLLLTFTTTLAAQAVPNLQNGKRYHIVCRQFTQGCVTDGASAAQQTPLYYLPSATSADETYWVFNEEHTGVFTIQNAKTGKYVTYDGVRDTYRRYVDMTSAKSRYSLWTFVEQGEGIYTIRNAQQTDHLWDVRVDSYMVGTYSNNGNGNQNQLFSMYDVLGSMVTEQGSGTADGFDVSSWLVANTNTVDGWQNEGGWFNQANGTYRNGEASIVPPFVENWHATQFGGLGNCSLLQTLEYLPAGSYTLRADMIAVFQGNGWWGQPEAPATGVTLCANEQSVSVGTANERPQRYTVGATLGSTGSLSLGVKVVNTNANWVALDNLLLIYHGTEAQLLEGEKAKVRAELAGYYPAEEIEQLLQKAGNSFEALEVLRKSVANLPTIDPLSRLVGQVFVDGHALVYTSSPGLYLCTVSLSQFGGDMVATITYTQRDGASPLQIDGTTVTSGSQYRFSNVTGGKEFTFSVTTAEGVTLSQRVTFTSLPVVRMYGSFNNSYAQGQIAVHEPDKAAPAMLNMKAKWRGGITNGSSKHKRNYHVKLLDDEGNKLEQKFFGLRNDNSWILEACQVDMSRVRNRVLTDLWNDYSTPPYYIAQEPKAMTGTRGKFVELVLNDEYRGIYCMTENMDRKQMKLKKYDEETQQIHGQLWKSKDWSYAVFMGHDYNSNYYPGTSPVGFNEYSESWDQYYVKYPDIDDVSPTNWRTLYDAVNFVCTSTDEYFGHAISDYFDIPLLIDHYILMETILSTDNHGKNMFFACYDRQKNRKITFGVWDMDATCGQRWSDDYWHQPLLGPEQDYAEYITNNEHGDYNLFKRLRETNAENFNDRVRNRYRDLRDSHLATESILGRFRSYLDEFKTCGADKREYAKWNGDTDISRRQLDFDNEMDYLTDWFTRRMNYLDTKRFDIGSLPPTGIGSVTAPANAPAVYSLSGQHMGQSLQQLPAGVYVVNGRKVVVK